MFRPSTPYTSRTTGGFVVFVLFSLATRNPVSPIIMDSFAPEVTVESFRDYKKNAGQRSRKEPKNMGE